MNPSLNTSLEWEIENTICVSFAISRLSGTRNSVGVARLAESVRRVSGPEVIKLFSF